MKLGIDLGGTKIEIAAFGPNGEFVLRRRVPTPFADYEAILATIGKLVANAKHELGSECTIGIGTPGAISSRTGLLKNSNSVILNGKPIDCDLSTLLGQPVRIENDANCFALSEAVDGAADGRRVVFGVILGTGVGGGLVVEQRVWRGLNAVAGEWGHNPLPWMTSDELSMAHRCYCGKVGCIETWLSGAGLSREHARRGADRVTATAIAMSARQGDARAQASLDVYKGRLARALAGFINVLDPEAIVLGGGLSNIDLIYKDLPELISEYAFSDGISTPILRARHGDSSGVRGAAWLWGHSE